MESVRTYSQTVDKVATCPEIATLVAEYQSNAQEMITKGQQMPSTVAALLILH